MSALGARVGRGAAMAAALALLAACEGAGLTGGGDASPEPSASAGATAPDAALSGNSTGTATGSGAGDTQVATAPPAGQPPAGSALGGPPAPETITRDDIREIFFTLEDGGPGGVVSVVFAIDNNADGNPRNDRALRLSPENNQCNPQELRRYDFPPGTPAVFGLTEARRGITPGTLPRFLAASVTRGMLDGKLAATEEETLPQNVCTRKLWEQIVLARQAQAQGQTQGQPAGQ